MLCRDKYDRTRRLQLRQKKKENIFNNLLAQKQTGRKCFMMDQA